MEVNKVYKINTAQGEMTVKLIEIKTNSMMPSDCIFQYEPDSKRPIIHPNAKELFGSEDIFCLPLGLMSKIKEQYGVEEVK